MFGRRIAGAVAAKRTIKRAWWFTCNRRVEVADAMSGVIVCPSPRDSGERVG